MDFEVDQMQCSVLLYLEWWTSVTPAPWIDLAAKVIVSSVGPAVLQPLILFFLDLPAGSWWQPSSAVMH
jgi:hypothetical protein